MNPDSDASEVALTEAEVLALPEGTPITVIWSGGNGPHGYVLTFDEWGAPYAWAKDLAGSDRLRFYNSLSFVGQEQFHTRVGSGLGLTSARSACDVTG